MEDRFKFRVFVRSLKKMYDWEELELNKDKLGKHEFYADDLSFLKFSLEEICNDNNLILMQCTGVKDKNGKLIYEGDVIQFRKAYRTYQTHVGDNIPNGRYTEPMEPGIKTIKTTVVFKNGMFQVEVSEEWGREYIPLDYIMVDWDLTRIKEAISLTRNDFDDWFEHPEDGDLIYLIEECAKVKDADELIKYLNGVEIIGNIYQNPELLEN